MKVGEFVYITHGMLCSPGEIAENIRSYTISSGKTQKEVFSTLHIDINQLTTMRRGHYPRIDVLYKIANYFGVTINDLVYKD